MSLIPFDYFVENNIHRRLKHEYDNSTADKLLSSTNTYKYYKVIYDFLTRNTKTLQVNPIGDLINSTGFLLNLLGTDYNIFREGRNDIEYRRAIQLRIFEIESTCLLEYVLQYIETLYAPNECYIIQDKAKMICIANLQNDEMVNDINKFKFIIAGGVGFELIYSIGIPFIFKDGEAFVKMIDHNNNVIIDHNGNPILLKAAGVDINGQYIPLAIPFGKVVCENFNA